LTPSERYRLAIEAYARADVDEFRRLSDTCAPARYWCADPQYTERFVASFAIALAAANFLLHASLPLAVAAAAKKARTEALELLMNQASATASAELRSADESTRLDRQERTAVMVGICKGITRFCDEIAVAPLKLLNLEPSCLPLFQTYSIVDIDLCDDEAAEAVYERLSSIWVSLIPGEPNRARAA
jgi:hypothetical protein